VQRLARAKAIVRPDTERWLRHTDSSGYDVFVSMNTLRDDATGRTRDEIAEIRHIYLDLDNGGPEALERLLARPNLPHPNHVLTTSPGKSQVVWQVEGFDREEAQQQRHLARDVGADPAATDSVRVLRVPGFRNHKYPETPVVESRKLSDEVHRPGDFPSYPEVDRAQERDTPDRGPTASQRHLASRPLRQSERDWAYAKRALARGERRESVAATIAAYRPDKHNPQGYAERTVSRASMGLETDRRSRIESNRQR
jgi:hypothetical protein